jgi:hypothetical protein
MLTHPEETQQMGKWGQEQVRHQRSAERMAEETLSLYMALRDDRENHPGFSLCLDAL